MSAPAPKAHTPFTASTAPKSTPKESKMPHPCLAHTPYTTIKCTCPPWDYTKSTWANVAAGAK